MEISWDNRGEIYLLWNDMENKAYIGQVKSFTPSRNKRGTMIRWYEHVRSAVKCKNKCIRLERAIRESGSEAFSVYLIQYAALAELDELETYYISLYNSTDIDYGYNMTPGGKIGGNALIHVKQSIHVRNQWKDPSFRSKISKAVGDASLKRWQDPICREKMLAAKRKHCVELPEYVYYYKKDGTVVGYKATMHHHFRCKRFGSSRLTMEEKLKLAVDQVDVWRKELGLY